MTVATYAQTFGDGSSTNFTINHGLGTLDVLVEVYVVATGVIVQLYTATIVNPDSVTLAFQSAPASNSLRVVVAGSTPTSMFGLGAISGISPTQSNVQAALKSFINAALPQFGADGNPISVIAAVQNRVPQPSGTDFVVMSPSRIDRLSTNVDSYADVKITGSIAPAVATFTAAIAAPTSPGPSVMTASAVTGTIAPGSALTGAGIEAGTTIIAQLTGTPGGAGTYSVTPPQGAPSTSATAAYGLLTATAVPIGAISAGEGLSGANVAPGTTVTGIQAGAGGPGTYYVAPSQTAAAGTITGGQKTITQSAEVTVQLDFHSAGNQASDYAQTVSTLLRDEFGTSYFSQLPTPLNGVSPLHADDPKHAPFTNEAQQVEWRWVLDACLQIYQSIVVPQDFADSVALSLVRIA